MRNPVEEHVYSFRDDVTPDPSHYSHLQPCLSVLPVLLLPTVSGAASQVRPARAAARQRGGVVREGWSLEASGADLYAIWVMMARRARRARPGAPGRRGHPPCRPPCRPPPRSREGWGWLGRRFRVVTCPGLGGPGWRCGAVFAYGVTGHARRIILSFSSYSRSAERGGLAGRAARRHCGTAAQWRGGSSEGAGKGRRLV